MSDTPLVTVTGGCHCGAVRFRAEAEQRPKMLNCNCSICSASGYLHLFIPHERFELLSSKDALTSYRFGTKQANHLFCSNCGVKSFYQPKSHPECWSVHLSCIDDASALDPQISDFDGKNWSEASKTIER